MSWLWKKKEEAEVEKNLVEEGKETFDETLQDSSLVSEIDLNNDDDNSNDVGKFHSGSDDELVEEGDDDNDEESSDESSLDNTSDDDDDDDDSLVVNLIESMTTEVETSEDDISIIFDSDDDDDDSDDNDDDDNNNYGDNYEDEDEAASAQCGKEDNTKVEPSNETEQDIQTTKTNDNSFNDQQSDVDDAGNDDPATSFWEKQSLLVLAAEHDRVDILKALLKDENEEKETLLNSGIPPLHLAISFGSVNTAQSLLRMGADPSVRPNIDVVLEERKNQPEDSKVDIPNIRRFEMITAWELAFGNTLYEKRAKLKTPSVPWSLFGSTTPAEADGTKKTTNKTTHDQIIKPIDMAPSKREGIRHAFTAEALRSVGSDEVERLKQLVCSGMPADIDIGGKDLYGWAVEMGALQCEEFLRPVEAAKYDDNDNDDIEITTNSLGSIDGETPVSSTIADIDKTTTKRLEENKKMSSFVVHRPDAEETIPQLKNRLDELDSLSMALSICLDNLAEEVSVCHGLLLMGGGASALASHVRSLRDLKAQNLSEMEDAELECLDAERELADLARSAGDIGKEIANIAITKFFTEDFDQQVILPSNNNGQLNTGPNKTGMNSNNNDNVDNSMGKQEDKVEQLNIRAQITASENKIRKLRASIADLSEENTRDLKEVKRRGLEGGINLVRGLREELRDLEYHLSEAQSMKIACKAKISMILARVPDQEDQNRLVDRYSDPTNLLIKPEVANYERSETYIATVSNETTDVNMSLDTCREIDKEGIHGAAVQNLSEMNTSQALKQNIFKPLTITPDSLSREKNSEGSKASDDQGSINKRSSSTKIASGDSQAIAIIQPGNEGFFTVDLWEVLLRIIGYEGAAYRRSVQNATKSTTSSRSNVMII